MSDVDQCPVPDEPPFERSGLFRSVSPLKRRVQRHMTRHGGDFWVEHLLFRNYLRAHSHVARRYEELKCDLMAAYASEPRTYNQGKSEFIQATVEQARAGR